MIFAGASAFRLNTSHSREDDHVKNIQLIRTVSASLKSHIPIILDLQGPKIRVGNISEAIEISKGDILTLEATDNIGNKNIIPVDYEGIAQDVSIGSEILLDDGKIVGKGKHLELLNSCRVYREIVKSQLSDKEYEAEIKKAGKQNKSIE